MIRVITILLAVAVALAVLTFFYDKQDVMENKPLLVVDSGSEGILPKRFRTMQDIIADANINTKGLSKIYASGSGAFTAKQLEGLKDTIESPNITIVDLRQESHGFINGKGISWYGTANAANKDKNLAEIQQDEAIKLAIIKASNSVNVAMIEKKSGGVITEYSTSSMKVSAVMPEHELAQLLGMGYSRFAVQDHSAPGNLEVDGYITLIRNLPKDGWLHAHCRGGKGRTTTFLALYDMMMNAKQVSLEDIIARQYVLGGSDLFKVSTDAYKQEAAETRKVFIRKFYKYAKENNDDFQTSWTEWLKERQG